ncbi:MAG: GNAT family N-acetyltransferase [Pyrinomonadaceae bacterium]
MDMEIKHEQKVNGGRFYIVDGGSPAGELTYQETSPGTIDIDHTEVDDKFRGEGLGQDLVSAVLEHSRENKLQVTASCPYAKKVIAEIGQSEKEMVD